MSLQAKGPNSWTGSWLFLGLLKNSDYRYNLRTMEFIKGFFTKDNFAMLFERFYAWLENILDTVFGGMGYEPLRGLFVNPWFWIILIALLVLGILFRKR